MKIPVNGFTHAGKFHADDVFATALLQIIRPDIRITRGFVVPDDFDGIVYDIGFGMFDHHQEPREYRANGIPYAAFGLLWRVLGPGLVGERQARLIDENFIQPLDLNDNTGEQNSLCDAIGFFNPVWDSKEDQDTCFFKAVAVAKQILENQIESANAVNRADEKVQQAYKNSRDGIVIHEGSLASLKRFKDDAREVAENYECGLTVEKFNDIKEGDIVEAFTMEEIPQ